MPSESLNNFLHNLPNCFWEFGSLSEHGRCENIDAAEFRSKNPRFVTRAKIHLKMSELTLMTLLPLAMLAGEQLVRFQQEHSSVRDKVLEQGRLLPAGLSGLGTICKVGELIMETRSICVTAFISRVKCYLATVLGII